MTVEGKSATRITRPIIKIAYMTLQLFVAIDPHLASTICTVTEILQILEIFFTSTELF